MFGLNFGNKKPEQPSTQEGSRIGKISRDTMTALMLALGVTGAYAGTGNTETAGVKNVKGSVELFQAPHAGVSIEKLQAMGALEDTITMALPSGTRTFEKSGEGYVLKVDGSDKETYIDEDGDGSVDKYQRTGKIETGGVWNLKDKQFSRVEGGEYYNGAVSIQENFNKEVSTILKYETKKQAKGGDSLASGEHQ